MKVIAGIYYMPYSCSYDIGVEGDKFAAVLMGIDKPITVLDYLLV